MHGKVLVFRDKYLPLGHVVKCGGKEGHVVGHGVAIEGGCSRLGGCYYQGSNKGDEG